jgi:Bacterial Ig domain
MKTGSLAALVTERGAARRALLAGTLIFGAIVILLAILAFALASPSQAQAQSNEIVEENMLPGSPKSEWDVQGAGDPNIQGFATDISVDQGQTVDFKVKTSANDYRLDIYRMGYYGGDGARKVDTVHPSAQLPQNQPDCQNEATTGLVDCGNWGVSASWDMPANAVSGIYFAKLVREDVQNSGGSHILFIVRDDDGNSDMLFQTSDTTWQAYNTYGGNSLYQGSTNNPAGRASKISYNRPFNTRAANNGEGEDWLFNSGYPMVRWLERNGYDVSYFTDVDSDRRGDEILEHEAFLSVGHDEYWSKDQRDNVEDARNAGVDLAFLSGNEVYWKTRWENSVDGSNTPYRTLVTYKEGDRGELTCGGKCDPNNNIWTGLWRTGGAPYDAGQPENALTGQISWVGTTSNIEVPAADGKLRFWRNTSIEDLQAGQEKSLPPGTLGYEWDYEQQEYEAFYPDGRITMSETTRDGKTHKLSLHRDDNGSGQDALVFGAGTVQWSWGLDDDHDRGGFGGPIPPPDQDMQQATVNLFADMGVQPATLQSGLTSAQASTDTTAPTSQITSPAAGATVEEDRPITITGTASDGDTGTVVGAVEVSVDGGNTWNRAEGREDWRFTWTPQTQDQATILSRAVDDSGNLESPSAGRTVTVGPRAPATCTDTSPCTIWDDTVTPANPTESDSNAVEVGVKFRSDTSCSQHSK